MQTVSADEKRRAERVRVRMVARYRSAALVIDGQVENLSRKGMFMRSDYLDDLGTQVSLELEVPGQGVRLRLSGEVVRVNEAGSGSGMAIRFSVLDTGVRRELANLVIERSYRAG